MDARLFRSLKRIGSGISICVLVTCLCGVSSSTAAAQSSSGKPLLKVLPRFRAATVPAMAPEETEAPALAAAAPTPAGLPGKGMAQHPMLYVGEGYNKILLVNEGKHRWTYSTGAGWEYDDVWMLSNGNVLFTRMQYIAEVTPEKKVVWRYDAPAGTEIHACQPIGRDKVLFVLNGLPPKLMVVNIKTGAVEVEHVLPGHQCDGYQDRARPVSARALHRAGDLPGAVPRDEPGDRVRQGLQRGLELRHSTAHGRRSV